MVFNSILLRDKASFAFFCETVKDSSNSTANELYEELRPTVSQVATPIVSSLSDSKKTDGSKSNGVRSWREDKSRSEQLLETKFHPDKDSTNKDQLATFAKKEREHQLYWINNEMNPTVTGNAKTSQLIQELVIANEITDISSKQNSLPVISCTSANDCSCSSSLASTSTSDGSSTTTQLCECCKREPVPKTSKPGSKEPKEKYILCHPCYNRNGGYSGENTRYLYPGHVCQCYTAMQADTVQRIHETIKELDDLEKEDDICKCTAKKQAASGYCKRCKCKLDDECFTKKGGLASDLTLKSDEEKKKSHKHKKIKCRPEVRIRVESPRKSKSHRSTNSHKSTHKQKCRCCKCNNSEEEDEEAKEDAMTVKSKHKKHKSKRRSTIQDYLYANKPKFVAAADERRQCMLDLAYLRGKRNEKYKQLLALANNLPGPTNAPKKRLRSNIEMRHLFDPKEMVQKTAKKYKKFPEVQQKMIDNRERQIKQANRLLADMFNRKLQEHVLKGRLTLPSDANIINLY